MISIVCDLIVQGDGIAGSRNEISVVIHGSALTNGDDEDNVQQL